MTAIPPQQPQPQSVGTPLLPQAALDAYDSLREFMLHGVTLEDGTYLHGFPELWKVMEACLCLCVSLMFKHRPAAMALTIIGTPSSGKGTVLSMLEGHPNFLLTLDDASLAAWVSQAKKRSGGIDLMEEAKHKVVVVNDVAALFYGKDPVLADKYRGRMARILDARGLVLSGGYQGRVGRTGDYLFGLIGGGTPPNDKDFRSMARVGPRLVSVRTDYDGIGDLTEEEVEQSESYLRRVEIGRQLVVGVAGALTLAIPNKNAVRTIDYNVAGDDKGVKEKIRHFANLLSVGRTMPGIGREKGYRVFYTLIDYARARAVWNRRCQIDDSDLLLVQTLTLGTMRPVWMALVSALVKAGQAGLTLAEVERATGMSQYKADLHLMPDSVRYGVTEKFVKKTGGADADAWRLTEEWTAKLGVL